MVSIRRYWWAFRFLLKHGQYGVRALEDYAIDLREGPKYLTANVKWLERVRAREHEKENFRKLKRGEPHIPDIDIPLM